MAGTETIEKPKRRRKRTPAAKDLGQASKATKPRKKPAAKPADGKANLNVEFMGVSIGDGTARVGLKISRNQLSVTKADTMLCGRRLTGTIVLAPPGDDPDQTYLFESVKHKITSTFDIKSFSLRPDWISCGLTFALTEIDCRELGNFAKKQGALVIEAVEEIPSKKAEEAEE